MLQRSGQVPRNGVHDDGRADRKGKDGRSISENFELPDDELRQMGGDCFPARSLPGFRIR